MLLNVLAVIVYLVCIVMGIGYVYNGYKTVRERTRVRYHRKYFYFWKPAELVTDTGRHTVIIGIGTAISGCVLFVATVLQLIHRKPDFLGFMFGAFLIVAIIQLGAFFVSVFFRETPVVDIPSRNE